MPESAIVVNTGPILALIAATGDLSLLPKLYSRVIVPREVCDEVLANGGTMFGATEFAFADGIERRTEPVVIGSLLSQLLDRGEASVVQLAISEGIETVCIDEHLGRRVARLNGLRVTGSLGVLIRAKREGYALCISDAGAFLSDRGWPPGDLWQLLGDRYPSTERSELRSLPPD